MSLYKLSTPLRPFFIRPVLGVSVHSFGDRFPPIFFSDLPTNFYIFRQKKIGKCVKKFGKNKRWNPKNPTHGKEFKVEEKKTVNSSRHLQCAWPSVALHFSLSRLCGFWVICCLTQTSCAPIRWLAQFDDVPQYIPCVFDVCRCLYTKQMQLDNGFHGYSVILPHILGHSHPIDFSAIYAPNCIRVWSICVTHSIHYATQTDFFDCDLASFSCLSPYPSILCRLSVHCTLHNWPFRSQNYTENYLSIVWCRCALVLRVPSTLNIKTDILSNRQWL